MTSAPRWHAAAPPRSKPCVRWHGTARKRRPRISPQSRLPGLSAASRYFSEAAATDAQPGMRLLALRGTERGVEEVHGLQEGGALIGAEPAEHPGQRGGCAV